MPNVQKDLRSAYLPSLVELLLLGAKSRPVSITTKELASRLGKSQQAASKHVLELEKEGYIERQRSGRSFAIRLTDRGANSLASFYLMLRSVMEEAPDIYEFHGIVFTGIGEGGYYMGLKGYRDQFKEKLSFYPYPGTLNLKLQSPVERQRLHELIQRQGMRVEGFADGKRTYGGLKFFNALVEDERGAVLAIDRTHYDNSVMEIISPVKLREALNLQDGSVVNIKVFM
ncbi:MAG: DUF120 domain-containing protein [Nitrososphaerota archaeon]|nr:DUF120 domain-containing protein [Nitrososphaerota archaeon]